MQAVRTIGLDIAKSVFQIHGVDAAGNVVVRPPAQAPLRLVILSEAPVVPHWHRSLRFISPLVARTAGSWSYGPPDATGLREALRQAAEE